MDLWNNIISEIKNKEMTATLLYSIKANISDSNIVLYAENDYLFGFAEKFKDKIAELFKLKTGKTAIITIVLENSSQSAPKIEKEDIVEEEDEEIPQTIIEEPQPETIRVEDEETQENIPDNVQKIAKNFGGKTRKIYKE